MDRYRFCRVQTRIFNLIAKYMGDDSPPTWPEETRLGLDKDFPKGWVEQDMTELYRRYWPQTDIYAKSPTASEPAE